MINVNTFKPGITFQVGNDIFVVLEASHSQQGRGQANLKAKVKNLRTGAITVQSYTGGDKVEPAHIEKKPMMYSYINGSALVLMDNTTFEQVEIQLEKIKWELNFLVEGSTVTVRMFENEILDIELDKNIELTVTEAHDAVKGNTTSNPQKKVKVETGLEVEVPMFIKQGERIIIATDTGKYVGRGK